MLWLVVDKTEPGYVNGHVKIGLFNAETKEEAIEKAATSMMSFSSGFYSDKDRHQEIVDRMVATEVDGDMIDIIDIPTDYTG